ncbi:MAG TPA: cytochrome P450 [Acidimicrobiales bacterium]
MTELYDPFSHELHDDPYPVYRTLRDEYPLYFCEARGIWVLSRFEDVWEAVHDPATFSSAQGVFPGLGEYNPDQMLPVMIMMDPPRHTELRSLVNRAFTRRRIADREEAIRGIARDLVDALVDAGEGDLVEDLAKPLPAIVIADLLGVPREDRKEFRHWSEQIIQDNPDDPAAAATAMEGGASLLAYFANLISERRRSPRDDLLNALITAEIDGERLSEDELFGMSVLLLVAGNETTTNLVSNSAVLFAHHPDHWQSVVADRSLLPGAVEECLRFDSPVQALARTLTRPVTIHGQTMNEGEKVLLVYGSANRDEREFPQPETFDIARTVDRQLAFGHGIHFCLGAPLARLEAQIAYSELAQRAPEWTVTGAPQRMHSGPIRGLSRLPVSMTG